MKMGKVGGDLRDETDLRYLTGILGSGALFLEPVTWE